MTPNDVLQPRGVRGGDVLEAQAHLTATGPGYDSGVHNEGWLVVWKPEDERERDAAFQVPAAVDSTATDRHIPDPARPMKRLIEELDVALDGHAAKGPKVKVLSDQRRHTMTIRPARIWGTVHKGRGSVRDLLAQLFAEVDQQMQLAEEGAGLLCREAILYSLASENVWRDCFSGWRNRRVPTCLDTIHVTQ